MSVATEFAPACYLPEPPPTRSVPGRRAEVITLHAPSERSIAAPLRLTRRGVLVLALAVLAACLGTVALAWASAPRPATPAHPVPAVITVQPGSTLWSIASRIAPDRDPRVEVALLERLNGLTGPALVPGQRLHTR